MVLTNTYNKKYLGGKIFSEISERKNKHILKIRLITHINNPNLDLVFGHENMYVQNPNVKMCF